MTAVHAAIVGAGPYGLSVAAHLRAAAISHRLYGQPMHSWASCMPQGMVLRSEPFASSLWDPHRNFTFGRFCAEQRIAYQPIGMPPTLEQFIDYADWFRQRAVGAASGDMIRRVRRHGKGFELTLANGVEHTATHVILATGYMAFRRVPAELAALPAPFAVHSALMADLASYTGRDVTIVGAGQSALESAALLHEAGASVRVVARAGRLKWNGGPKPDRNWLDRLSKPYAGLGAGWKELAISELPQVYRTLFPADKRHRHVAQSFGPAGAWWLRPRVEDRIETRLGSEIVSARVEGDQVALVVRQDGRTSEFRTDRIVAATGYKVDLARLDYVDPALAAQIDREGDAPRLDRSFETSVPGLFVVGAASAPTFGPVMRFMFGAKHAAPTLARRLRRA